MAVFLALVGLIGVAMLGIAALIASELPDIYADPTTKPFVPRVCDACGSGGWHPDWDPDSERRKSRNFYCPNCTGAD